MNEKTSTLERDCFTDYALLPDPYSYFETIRAGGPVVVAGDPAIAYVTGFEESVEILNDASRFSSLPAATGPKTALSFVPQGDDITDQIAASRDPDSPLSLLVTYDGQQHSLNRALLSKLFTPLRLKQSEAFMRDHAASAVGKVVAEQGCEIIDDIAAPYVTYVIADMLGVPDADRIRFKDSIRENAPAGFLGDPLGIVPSAPLQYMYDFFLRYLTDRREKPRDDVMSWLAAACYADGTRPPILEIVKSAMFLFSAGQDTSALLLCNALRYLAEHPDLQRRLRADDTLLPNFVEEMMRMHGSIKMTSRLTVRTTKVGGVELKAGTPIAVILAAANRDPRQWENPGEFDLERPKLKQQVGFSRGAHTCLGAPLARAEVTLMLEAFLDQTSSIEIDEARHGPAEDRRFKYVPSFMNYGLEELHLKFTPASSDIKG